MTMTLTDTRGVVAAKPPRFAGYAALFDIADEGGDTIRRGAFAASLAALKARGDPLPLLWQHNISQTIGWIEQIDEDQRGLRVIARLADGDGPRAALLREGAVRGLSFGYRARAAREIALPSGRGGRELTEIDLFEVSLVTDPMHPHARVHLVI